MCRFTAAIDPRPDPSLCSAPELLPAAASPSSIQEQRSMDSSGSLMRGRPGNQVQTKPRTSKKNVEKEKRKASLVEEAFGAIKPEPLNQFAVIWTGPSQSRKCQAANFPREQQPLCLHTERKAKI
ncbi:uncharacterized protein V6R79_020677 [Siganus canaliculatus]